MAEESNQQQTLKEQAAQQADKASSSPLHPQPAPGPSTFAGTPPPASQLDPNLPHNPEAMEKMGAPDEVYEERYGRKPESPSGMADPQGDAVNAAKAAKSE